MAYWIGFRLCRIKLEMVDYESNAASVDLVANIKKNRVSFSVG
jgi:hypothetical protein